MLIRHMAVLCVLSSAVFGSDPVASPRLKVTEVVDIARDAAIKKGRVLNDYLPPKPEFVATRGEWVITFTGKVPNRGNYFDVRVNDQTRQITIVGGE